jgi:2,3-bisphosphoglycerate-independent phosphoglycerate mutase
VNLGLMSELSITTDSKIVLLVLDGLGGVPGSDGETELEAAHTPELDALATRSELGLSRPVAAGITPGSGPGHLSLFGYNPVEYEVGRGVPSALGVGFELGPGDLAARMNFATRDETGKITDRRAGRIPDETGRRLAELLDREVSLDGIETFVLHEKEYRAVVVFRGEGLSDELTDSDPQQTGRRPLAVEATDPAAERSAGLANAFISLADEALQDQSPANTILVRGFGIRPAIPSFAEVYKLNAATIAGYPMYKGLARLVGMEILREQDGIAGEMAALKENWGSHDFFFVHVKPADSAGEDKDFGKKVGVIEEVDAIIPEIRALKPAALAIAGDHSTPAKLGSHSWHPVPFLLHSEWAVPDGENGGFGERACARGTLGVFPAEEIMGLLMANALKLKKYGA